MHNVGKEFSGSDNVESTTLGSSLNSDAGGLTNPNN